MALRLFQGHFREHLNAGLPELPIAAFREVRGQGYWDAGWRAVTDGLSFSSNGLGDKVLAEVRALECELRPRTLDECFDAFVIGEPWRHWHPTRTERRPARDVAKLAEATGICLARTGADPIPYLGRLIAAEGQNSAWMFARGFARTSAEPAKLWQTACAIFGVAEPAHRDPGVLAGIIDGAARNDRPIVEAWLDAAITDPLLGEHLVVLQLAVPLDAGAMARFNRALAHGAVSLWRFAYLRSGGVTKLIPAPSLSDFLGALYEADGGVLPALQILHMRIFGDRSDKRDVGPSLIALGRRFLADPRTYVVENTNEDHGIAAIAKVALAGDGAADAAAATCRAFRGDPGAQSFHSSEFDGLSSVLMKSFPRIVLDEIVAHGARDGLTARLFGGHERDDDDVDQRTIKFDEGIALEWMRASPKYRASVLAEVVPYTQKNDATGLLGWSTLARELINAVPDPLVILQIFEERFFTGSGTGPFSARFVRRRPLVAEMMAHDDTRVRNWARAAGHALEETITRWDELDRIGESRFE